MSRHCPNVVLGVDFDNTLISYDHLMLKAARDRGLVSKSRFGKSSGKKQIRDQIRSLPNGEMEWRKLQAEVYGPRIGEARLISGVASFFKQCKTQKVPVHVISHKTKFAGQDETRTNLRMAAIRWMKQNHFFDPHRMGLVMRNVFFESARKRKLKRISDLRCTHFIDDMEETFLEADFPKGVEKILYDSHAPARKRRIPGGIRVFRRWSEIKNHVFCGRN